MYFEITTTSKSALEYSLELPNNQWLHTCWPVTDYSQVGYQLGQHGGNFVNFAIDTNFNIAIEFSFYKDFYLTHSPADGIILSNINDNLKKISNTVISAKLYNGKLKLIHYELTKVFNNHYPITFDHAVDQFEQRLLENIIQCTRLKTPTKIVYTGGLDSSTSAFVAQHHNVDFIAIVNSAHKKYWKQLPFTQIQYSQDLAAPTCLTFPGPTNNIKSSFYQIEFDKSITGFYGDLVMVHNHTWFNQCAHLSTNQYRYPVYDKTVVTNATLIFDEVRSRIAILKNHSLPWFRHWFKNFEILDPYRDPEILKITLSLNFQDLVEQAATGRIQKQLLDKLGVDRSKFICDYKNDYSKF
jgi:hypothetical protein